jgi:hypothetical protein
VAPQRSMPSYLATITDKSAAAPDAELAAAP